MQSVCTRRGGIKARFTCAGTPLNASSNTVSARRDGWNVLQKSRPKGSVTIWAGCCTKRAELSGCQGIAISSWPFKR